MDRSLNVGIASLADSINKYLGLAVQNNMEQAKETRANQAKLGQMNYQQQLDLNKQSNQANLDLAGKSALKAYELTLEGKLDADTASQLFPEGAKLVESFNEKNGRYPTVAEFDKMTSGSGKEDQKTANRENRINTAILNYTEKLEKNPIYLKFREQGISFDQLDELASQAKAGNTVASAAMGIKAAKAMGEVGVMTEQDIKRYVQSGQIVQSTADKLSKWITGAPTDATVDEVQQIANVLKAQFKDKAQPIYDTYINRLSENMGISKEDAARRLDVPYAGGKQGKTADEVKGETKQQGGQMIHTYPSGKKAIFNPKTNAWEQYNG